MPGNSKVECGNYRNLDLTLAKEEAEMYLGRIINITENDLEYK